MARLAPPALGAAGTRASAAGSWQGRQRAEPLPQSVVLEAKKLYTEQQGGPPPTDREALEVLRANLPTPPLPKAIVDAARSLYAARVGGAPPDDNVAIELLRATLPGHSPVRLQPPSLGEASKGEKPRRAAATRRRRRLRPSSGLGSRSCSLRRSRCAPAGRARRQRSRRPPSSRGRPRRAPPPF